jgi:hypothetical protein
MSLDHHFHLTTDREFAQRPAVTAASLDIQHHLGRAETFENLDGKALTGFREASTSPRARQDKTEGLDAEACRLAG